MNMNDLEKEALARYTQQKTLELKGVGVVVTESKTNSEWRNAFEKCVHANLVFFIDQLAISTNILIQESGAIDDGVFNVLDIHESNMQNFGVFSRFICKSEKSIVDAAEKTKSIVGEWVVEKEKELNKGKELLALLG